MADDQHVPAQDVDPFYRRFLVSAEAYRIPVIILFNKTDLYGEPEFEEMNYLDSVYRGIGYRCMQLSLQSREGLEEVTKTHLYSTPAHQTLAHLLPI